VVVVLDGVSCFSSVANFPDYDALNHDRRSIFVIHLALRGLEVTDLEGHLRLCVQGVCPEDAILFQSTDVLGAVSQEYRLVWIDAGDALACAAAG